MNKEKIIVALDVETAEKAREIIGELSGEVGAFKIGLQLFTSAGAPFVREAVESGIKIFLDVKFHDIPNTVAKASIEVARLGVWMFNVHALGGGEMMRKTVEDAREICDRENLKQPKIIGVTVLTSSNQETLRQIGIDRELNEQVLSLAKLTAKCGLDGVVASPLEIEAIRETVERKDFLIVTPGIRSDAETRRRGDAEILEEEKRRGGEEERGRRGESGVSEVRRPKTDVRFETFDDQKRVMTAREAVEAGADYLVIGRPILRAGNKIEAARKFLEEIKTASA